MSTIGYATLGIIPSMQGVSQMVERELAPQLARVGRTAGTTAGREVGKGIATGAKESASGNVFSNIEKGATVAGVGAGRRFGTALHETLGEYTKTIGATMVGFFAYEKVKEALGEIVTEGQAAAKTSRLTEAVIKSTGGAANVSANHVDELAKSLGNMAALDDDTVKAGENMLLTFRNVRNEVGRGNDIFDQATTSIVNMASAMAASSGGEIDLKSSAILVGKALNDPVKGLAALQRVGVTFDASTKETIKSLIAQGKTLDAQKVILGELKTEFGGAAAALSDPVKRAQADWKNFEEELGLKVLPIINGVARAFSEDALPALKSTGSYVGEVAKGWGNLPAPIKAATLAFVAYKAASKAGYIDAVSASFANLRAGIALTAETYDTARASQGRFSSGLTALREGVSLTNTATRRSIAGIAGMGIALSGLDSSSNKTTRSLSQIATGAAMGFAAGGPWGAAIGGAIGLLGTLAHAGGAVASSQEKIKASVQEVTDTLNQQTGAITGNTVEAAKKALADGGVYAAAKKLGLNLGDVTRAYLGNVDAAHRVGEATQVSVTDAMHKGRDAMNGIAPAYNIVNNAVLTQGSAMSAARTKILDMRTATQELKGENKTAGDSFRSITDRIDKARQAIVKLMNAENKRRIQNLQDKQDRLSLIEQMQATADEAKKGKKTLDENTKAGQSNAQALYDLANQWNNSSRAVRQAKGEYKAIREAFIADAIKMGDTATQAGKLADAILTVPKHHAIDIKTPGMKQALADLATLRQRVKDDQKLAVNVSTHMSGDRRLAGARALGGPVVKGSSYLVGERGPEIFTPGQSGGITPNDKIGRGGDTYHVTVIADDPYKFKRDLEHAARGAAIGAVDFT